MVNAAPESQAVATTTRSRHLDLRKLRSSCVTLDSLESIAKGDQVGWIRVSIASIEGGSVYTFDDNHCPAILGGLENTRADEQLLAHVRSEG